MQTLSFKQHVAACAKSALYGIHLNQKCKEISYNGHYKNADVHSGTIPVGLYKLHPNKNISHYHQTITKNSEPSCKNHL